MILRRVHVHRGAGQILRHLPLHQPVLARRHHAARGRARDGKPPQLRARGEAEVAQIARHRRPAGVVLDRILQRLAAELDDQHVAFDDRSPDGSERVDRG